MGGNFPEKVLCVRNGTIAERNRVKTCGIWLYEQRTEPDRQIAQAMSMQNPARLRQDPPVIAAGYVSTRRGIFPRGRYE